MANETVAKKIYQLLTGGATPPSTVRGAGALGLRYDKAAAADPQNVWQTLFTIAGGIIGITGLFGVRTVVQGGGASTMQFRHSVPPTVLDAGTLSVAADGVGTIYALTGAVGDPIAQGLIFAPVSPAKVVATSATYGSPVLFLAGPGTIQVTMTAAAGTGSTRYFITYIPMDDTVTVT